MPSYIMGNNYYKNYPQVIGLLLRTIPMKKCRVQHFPQLCSVIDKNSQAL